MDLSDNQGLLCSWGQKDDLFFCFFGVLKRQFQKKKSKKLPMLFRRTLGFCARGSGTERLFSFVFLSRSNRGFRVMTSTDLDHGHGVHLGGILRGILKSGRLPSEYGAGCFYHRRHSMEWATIMSSRRLGSRFTGSKVQDGAIIFVFKACCCCTRLLQMLLPRSVGNKPLPPHKPVLSLVN